MNSIIQLNYTLAEINYHVVSFQKQSKNHCKHLCVYGRLSKHLSVTVFPLLVVINFPLQCLSMKQKSHPSSKGKVNSFCLKCSFHIKDESPFCGISHMN